MKKLQILKIFFAAGVIFLTACEGENGEPGLNSLVLTNVIPDGDANCPNGGTRVESGIDLNGNGQLDADEATVTYVCNGTDGIDGTSGEDGANGSSSIISVTPLAAGGVCTLGGVEVTWGVDSDDNGELNGDEINTNTVCSGGISLINITDLAVGSAECSNGGIQIEIGIDDNGDGVLSAADNEIDEIRIICNGVDGLDGVDGQDGTFDMEVRLPFPAGNELFTTTEIMGEISPDNLISNFNISNYPGVTSIVLQADLATTDVNVECTLGLWNETEGTVLTNSGIGYSQLEFQVGESANFIEDLAQDESVDLLPVLFSEVQGVTVGFRNAVLILRR